MSPNRSSNNSQWNERILAIKAQKIILYNHSNKLISAPAESMFARSWGIRIFLVKFSSIWHESSSMIKFREAEFSTDAK